MWASSSRPSRKSVRGLGFEAEIHYRIRSGVPDVFLKYKDRVVAVIEVKKPEISLSDPKLNEQALRYAKIVQNTQEDRIIWNT